MRLRRALTALAVGLVLLPAPAATAAEADGDVEQARQEQRAAEDAAAQAARRVEESRAALAEAQGAAEQAQREADLAQAQVAEVQVRLDAVVARLSAAEAALGRAERREQEAEDAVAEGRRAVAELEERAEARARAAVTRGAAGDPLLQVLTSADPQEVADGLSLLRAVRQADDEQWLDARRTAVGLEERELALREARAEAEARRADVASEQAAVARLLGEASRAQAAADEALERARLEVALGEDLVAGQEADQARAEAQARVAAEQTQRREAERAEAAARVAALQAAEESARATQRPSRSASAPAAAPAPTAGGYSCLVDDRLDSFTNTWGAARSGGRSHQGVDVFAPYGSPVYAVEDGVITRASSNRLGGLAIYLRGDSGKRYYYAHQSRNSVSSGQRVRVGQVIGAVGTSGNAQGTPPHVHFEVHPGGGSAVDPTPFTRAVCPR